MSLSVLTVKNPQGFVKTKSSFCQLCSSGLRIMAGSQILLSKTMAQGTDYQADGQVVSPLSCQFGKRGDLAGQTQPATT